MGSKRSSSSKHTSKARSSPPPADPSVDGNSQNPSHGTPSKSRKKPKLSAPTSNDSSFLSPTPSTEGESHSQDNNRKGKAAEVSNERQDGAVSRSSSLRWGEAETLKLLKSLIALRAKSGYIATSTNVSVLLKEIKNWVPSQLSEKNLSSKLRHLRFKFHKNPKPGPESSDFDRSFYELGLKVWGQESLKDKGNDAGAAKEHGGVEKKANATGKRTKVSKKSKGEKKNVVDEKDDDDAVEEEERDSEHDEDAQEKAEKNLVMEDGEEHEKDELLVGGDNGLFEAKGAEHSYKYLRLALEEYWTESKLNMDTLYAALPKVNPVQAKHLDENFREVFVRMLKLKMEKNQVSNEIIRASLGC